MEITYAIPVLILVGMGIIALLDSLGVSLLQRIFAKELTGLMRAKPQRVAGIIVWLLLAGGICLFVVFNPIAGGDPKSIGVLGVFFGLIVYGVYECTNKALIRNRPRRLVLADLFRGMVLCGLTAFLLAHIRIFLTI